MSDITMCEGTGCPLNKKNKCYRFRATPSSYQSYFTETPYNEETKLCEYFWKIKGPTARQLKRKEDK